MKHKEVGYACRVTLNAGDYESVQVEHSGVALVEDDSAKLARKKLVKSVREPLEDEVDALREQFAKRKESLKKRR